MGSQSTDLSSLRRDCWGWLLPNPAARRVSYTDTRSIPFYLSPWIYRRAHRRAFTSNRRLNASSRFLNLSLRKRSAELTYRGRRNFWNTRLGKFRAISLEESSETVIVADRYPIESPWNANCRQERMARCIFPPPQRVIARRGAVIKASRVAYRDHRR